MIRRLRPEDLAAVRIPVELALSADGRLIAYAVKEATRDAQGYRYSTYIASADGGGRPTRIGRRVGTDRRPTFSPDGMTVAIVTSDRSRSGSHIWLHDIASRRLELLSSFQAQVVELVWGPDGRQICVVAASRPETRESSATAKGPVSDLRSIDGLNYQMDGQGFTYDGPTHLWSLDVDNGSARQLTSGPWPDSDPAWSPDGRRIAFVSRRQEDADLMDAFRRTGLFLLNLPSCQVTSINATQVHQFAHPAWSPDGETIAAVGHHFELGNATRSDVWLFEPSAADPGRNLTSGSDLYFGALLAQDLLPLPDGRVSWSPDGRWLYCGAPIAGSFELWRVDPRRSSVEQVTDGQHVILDERVTAGPDGQTRIAAVRATPVDPPDIVIFDVPSGDGLAEPRPRTHLMRRRWKDVQLVAPTSFLYSSDSKTIQGWYYRPADSQGPAPMVALLHGGPHALFGATFSFECQLLVAAGIGVFLPNPRGSMGYGQDFCSATFRDWGPGPMRDVLVGIQTLVESEHVDSGRIGVTGSSYGGYLTNWLVGHTDRFAAAITRSGISDLYSDMLSFDLAGNYYPEWGVAPWEDPALYHEHSPITYATDVTTPLLIIHPLDDIRTPFTQAQELFTVLRANRRTARLLGVPDETHGAMRTGAPFRRVEYVRAIRDWFVHFLVDGGRSLPAAYGPLADKRLAERQLSEVRDSDRVGGTSDPGLRP